MSEPPQEPGATGGQDAGGVPTEETMEETMEETVLDPLLASKEQAGSLGRGPGQCHWPPASQPRLPSVTLGGAERDPGNSASSGVQTSPPGKAPQGGQARHQWVR